MPVIMGRHWARSSFRNILQIFREKPESSNVDYLGREPRSLHTSIAVANHCDRARFFGSPVELGPLVLRRNKKPDPWPCKRY